MLIEKGWHFTHTYVLNWIFFFRPKKELDFFNNLGKILSESTNFIVERIKREKIERILNELINPNKKYNERIDIKNKISWKEIYNRNDTK